MSTNESSFQAPQFFSVENWLESRAAASGYTVVELGHADAPIAANDRFDGARVYIGIEAWINSAYAQGGAAVIDDLRSSRPEENLFFLSCNTGFEEGQFLPGVADGLERSAPRSYEVATVLPDEVADEVFLGNVFGDPRVKSSPERTAALFREVLRIARPGGRIILRETVTPYRDELLGRLADQNGVRTEAKVTRQDVVDWCALEASYRPSRADGEYPARNSYYWLLAKS